MGLAAVTEANTGDFTVRLKTDRSRAIDEVIADAREQIHAAEPSLDMEFTQVLQDMIGDLSNSPEPIQIKLFSNDQNLLLTLGPRVQQAIAKIPGVVDTQNGVDNTISGPATNFQIDPVVAGTARLYADRGCRGCYFYSRWLADKRSADFRWPALHHSSALARRQSCFSRRHREHRLQQQQRPHRYPERDGHGDPVAATE